MVQIKWFLAWMGPELLRKQESDWHRLTHAQMQAMTIPDGQNWPWVKIGSALSQGQGATYISVSVKTN